jgi:type VI secretion system VasD/TssJ family lipoprotein
VDIRIFQLKDDARFNQATVDQIWTNPKEVLADDVIAMKQVTVFPGAAEDKAASFELGDLPDTVRFLGVLALFPKEDDKGPRKLVLPKKDSGTVIRFTGYHLVAEK